MSYTEITTVEEGFKRQKDQIDFNNLPDLSILPDKYSRGMLALLHLQVLTDAVNNDDPAVPDFEPDYNNTDQEKWSPLYIGGDSSGAGFRFVAYCGWAITVTGGGARLALRDKPRALHMKKHFSHLYKELYLILK